MSSMPHSARLAATSVLFAFFIANPSLAQSGPVNPEQAFKEIGQSLQTMQRTIESAQAQNPIAPPTGTELTAAAPVTALIGPSPTAGIGATLTPGTKVRVQSVVNGFVQVIPYDGPTAGKPVFVPQGVVKTGFSDWLGGGQAANSMVAELIEQANRLRMVVENNPYVRLKGFKVNVGIPPSLDIDFEMKNEGVPPSPASAPRQLPAP